MEMHEEILDYEGMDRESMKEAVLQKLAIGQQYKVRSTHASQKDEGKVVKCRLADLSQNVAVFLHKNGTSESFTYQELCIQMMEGNFV